MRNKILNTPGRELTFKEYNPPEYVYSHQINTIAYGMLLGSFADLSDLGTGKTLSQIELMRYRFKKGLTNKALIVCPKANIYDPWLSDLKQFWNNRPFDLILDKGSARNKKLLEQAKNFKQYIAIINYESVYPIRDILINIGFDQIVLDESTYIKNYTSKRTKACIKIGLNIKYKSIMTGLPTPKGALDIFSQYKFLDDTVFGHKITKFRFNFFTSWHTPFGYNEYFLRDDKKELLKEKIMSIAIRHSKSECLDLPDKVLINEEVNLSEEQAGVYNKFKEDLYAELVDGRCLKASVAATRLQKLAQINQGFIYITNPAATDHEEPFIFKKNPKHDRIKELIDQIISQGDKAIIWSVYIKECNMLSELLKEYNPAQIYGSHRKEENINKFKSDESKILVANPQSASHGLNFTVANYCIWSSYTFNYEHYFQANGRIDRIGQEKKMTYIHLKAKNTIDDYYIKNLTGKENFNSFILNNLKGILT